MADHVICLLVAAAAFLLALRLLSGGGTRIPWWAAAVAAAAGAAVTVPIGAAEDALLAALSPAPPAWGVAAVAAAAEEGAKAVLAVAIAEFAMHRRPPTADGFLMGALAGLGMAVFESAIYHHGRLGEGWTFLPPETVRLLGHLVFGGLAGAGAVALKGGCPWAAAVALPASVALHFALDWTSLSSKFTEGRPFLRSAVVAAVFSAAGVVCLSLRDRATGRSEGRSGAGRGRSSRST